MSSRGHASDRPTARAPLVVTNGTSQMTDGTVGAAYAIGLFARTQQFAIRVPP